MTRAKYTNHIRVAHEGTGSHPVHLTINGRTYALTEAQRHSLRAQLAPRAARRAAAPSRQQALRERLAAKVAAGEIPTGQETS